MTAAANLTYSSLVTDIGNYAERYDAVFVAQVPRFIMLAENRIAAEARGLGFIVSATDTMLTGQNGSALAKPSRWRETVSLSIGTPGPSTFNSRKALKMRTYEYCRYYAPDPTSSAEPVYYAEWDWQHFLIAPSPLYAYPFEIIYFERPVALDSDNSTNWTTQYAPQLLTFACLLEASAFVKNKDQIEVWQHGYDRALKQVEFESKRRGVDRTQSTQSAA